MIATSVNTIRADHIGSLLRPDYLKEAVYKSHRSEIGPEELTAAQDRAALENIRLQEEAGLQVTTDGEVRRESYTDPLTKSLGGWTPGVGNPAPTFRDEHGPRELRRQAAVTEKLRLDRNLPLQE